MGFHEFKKLANVTSFKISNIFQSKSFFNSLVKKIFFAHAQCTYPLPAYDPFRQLITNIILVFFRNGANNGNEIDFTGAQTDVPIRGA